MDRSNYARARVISSPNPSRTASAYPPTGQQYAPSSYATPGANRSLSGGGAAGADKMKEDAILARYEDLKREMEAPSATTPAKATGYSATTTPNMTAGTVYGSQAYGTSPSASYHPGGGYQRSTTPTTFNRRSASDAKEAADATLALARDGGDAKARALQRLEDENAKLRKLMVERREDDAQQRNATETLLRDECRTLKERLQSLQQELATERSRRAQAESREQNSVVEESKRGSQLQSRLLELERMVSGQRDEIDSLRAAKRMAEQKQTESLSVINDLRGLEGKVAALSQLAESRSRECDDERRKTAELSRDIRDLNGTIETLRHTIAGKDRQIAEGNTALSQAKQDTQHMHAKTQELKIAMEQSSAKISELEGSLQRMSEGMDQQQSIHREELRAKNKALSAVEVELTSMQERLRESQSSLQKSFHEAKRLSSENCDLGQKLTDAERANEGLETQLGKAHVMAESLGHDLDRAAHNKLESDQQHTATVLELRRVTEALDGEKRIRASLEEQLANQKQAFFRQEAEMAASAAHHEDTIQRLSAAETKASELHRAEIRVSDLEQELYKTKLALEMADQQVTQRADRVRELEDHLEVERSAVHRLKSDYIESQESRRALESHVRTLQDDLELAGELSGRISALNRVLEDRSAELSECSAALADANSRNAVLEDVAREAETLKLRARDDAERVAQSTEKLERAEAEVEALGARVAMLEAQHRHGEELLSDRGRVVEQLEAEVHDLRAVRADNASLEIRVRQLEGDCDAAAAQISDLQRLLDDAVAKMRGRDHALADERQRVSDLSDLLESEKAAFGQL